MSKEINFLIAGFVTTNVLSDFRIGSIGRVVNGIEVKFQTDSEWENKVILYFYFVI